MMVTAPRVRASMRRIIQGLGKTMPRSISESAGIEMPRCPAPPARSKPLDSLQRRSIGQLRSDLPGWRQSQGNSHTANFSSVGMPKLPVFLAFLGIAISPVGLIVVGKSWQGCAHIVFVFRFWTKLLGDKMTSHPRSWRRFQQRTGWPFGPILTAAWLIGVPTAVGVVLALSDWLSQ